MPAGKDEIPRNRNRYRAVPVAFDAFMLGTPRVGQLVLSLRTSPGIPADQQNLVKKRWMPE
jgi:hypothetical protein